MAIDHFFFSCREVMSYFWGAHRLSAGLIGLERSWKAGGNHPASIKCKRHLSQTLLVGDMFAATRGKILFGQVHTDIYNDVAVSVAGGRDADLEHSHVLTGLVQNGKSKNIGHS